VSDPKVMAVGAPPTFRMQVARALDVVPETVEWVPTVSAAEEALATLRDPPSAVVLSPLVKDVDAFGMADFVGKTSPASAVLLVRERADNGLLPKAMRAGVRDVVDLSRGGEELREALTRAVAWSASLRTARSGGAPASEAARRGRVVSVFSSKGGTGKTFLACNLAWALAEVRHVDTAILDLEFGVGDVFSFYGREPSHALQDVLAVGDLEDRDVIRDVGVKLNDRLWGYGSPPDPAAGSVSGEVIGKVIRALRRAFDVVVVDGTNEYSDAALAAFDLSDTVCLVTGLDVVGVRHLSVALHTLLSLGFPRDRFRIVLNRADSKVGLSPQDVERVMKIKVDAMLPSSRLVPMSLNRGRPVVQEHPKSDVSRAVVSLAEKLAGVPTKAKHGVFGFGKH
jgi:pilus assembly protein CpaE